MRTSIGLVDYGAGNQTSLLNALRELGYRCRVSRDAEVLDGTDILILPGVGAFPTAMDNLEQNGLIDYLRDQAGRGRPILGICLGMQLFADISSENGEAAGLGLIPGKVVPLKCPHWHIGWNSVEPIKLSPIFSDVSEGWFYFNHSFTFECPDQYRFCQTSHGQTIVAAIQKKNLIGLQFHPEKSQTVGRKLLRKIVEGLRRA